MRNEYLSKMDAIESADEEKHRSVYGNVEPNSGRATAWENLQESNPGAGAICIGRSNFRPPGGVKPGHFGSP